MTHSARISNFQRISLTELIFGEPGHITAPSSAFGFTALGLVSYLLVQLGLVKEVKKLCSKKSVRQLILVGNVSTVNTVLGTYNRI